MRKHGNAADRAEAFTGQDFAGGSGNGGGFFQAQNAAFAGAENVTGDGIFDRNDSVLVDDAAASGEVAHFETQDAGFGVVDEEAGVIQVEGAAEGLGNGLKERFGRQAAHYGVVDFEERAEAVAFARELFLIGEHGFVVEGVIDGHGHLAGHLAHELDVFGRVGVLAHGAEIEAAEIAPGGEERQGAEGLDAVGAEDGFQDGVEVECAGIGGVIRLAGLEGRAGGGLVKRHLVEMAADDGVVGLENVQAENFGFRIEKREADEVEGDEVPEAGAQIGEEGGKLAVGRDGFGDLQQRFIARPDFVWMDLGRRGHRNAARAILQP